MAGYSCDSSHPYRLALSVFLDMNPFGIVMLLLSMVASFALLSLWAMGVALWVSMRHVSIIYRADEFHAFDGGGVGRALGLLPLNGDIGGHKPVICKPVATTPELDLRRTFLGGKG